MAQVIISAGHSPIDKGAVVDGLVEFDLTRKITDELEELIKKYPKLNYKRIPGELSLPQKIQWINSTGNVAENNDIAVEVHINDGDGTEDGIECWYAERGENASKNLCQKLIENVAAETGMRKRSVNSEYDHPFRRLGYVHNTRTISALIEVGFMDHPKDRKILTSDEGVKNIAKGLLKGILAYYNLSEEDLEKEPESKPQFPIHTDLGVTMDPYSNMNMPMGMPNSTIPNYTDPFNTAMTGANYVPTGNAFGNQALNSIPSTTPQMTYQERVEMITHLFQKILGRNPDTKSLNYYSSSQMSEEALMKLMIDSAEHKGLLKAARDYVSTKALLNKSEREIIELQRKVQDKDTEVESLRNYLNLKNNSTSNEKDLKPAENNKKVKEESSEYLGQEEKKAKKEIVSKKIRSDQNSVYSTIKGHSLKSVVKPAGPINGFVKLVRTLVGLFIKD